MPGDDGAERKPTKGSGKEAKPKAKAKVKVKAQPQPKDIEVEHDEDGRRNGKRRGGRDQDADKKSGWKDSEDRGQKVEKGRNRRDEQGDASEKREKGNRARGARGRDEQSGSTELASAGEGRRNRAQKDLSGGALLSMLKPPPPVTRYTRFELLSISQLPASKMKPASMHELIDRENKASMLLPRNRLDREDGEEVDPSIARRERRRGRRAEAEAEDDDRRDRPESPGSRHARSHKEVSRAEWDLPSKDDKLLIQDARGGACSSSAPAPGFAGAGPGQTRFDPFEDSNAGAGFFCDDEEGAFLVSSAGQSRGFGKWFVGKNADEAEDSFGSLGSNGSPDTSRSKGDSPPFGAVGQLEKLVEENRLLSPIHSPSAAQVPSAFGSPEHSRPPRLTASGDEPSPTPSSPATASSNHAAGRDILNLLGKGDRPDAENYVSSPMTGASKLSVSDLFSFARGKDKELPPIPQVSSLKEPALSTDQNMRNVNQLWSKGAGFPQSMAGARCPTGAAYGHSSSSSRGYGQGRAPAQGLQQGFNAAGQAVDGYMGHALYAEGSRAATLHAQAAAAQAWDAHPNGHGYYGNGHNVAYNQWLASYAAYGSEYQALYANGGVGHLAGTNMGAASMTHQARQAAAMHVAPAETPWSQAYAAEAAAAVAAQSMQARGNHQAQDKDAEGCSQS